MFCPLLLCFSSKIRINGCIVTIYLSTMHSLSLYYLKCTGVLYKKQGIKPKVCTSTINNFTQGYTILQQILWHKNGVNVFLRVILFVIYIICVILFVISSKRWHLSLQTWLISPLISWIIHAFIHSFIHLTIYWFIHLFIYSFI